MQVEIKEIQKQLGMTVIYVTHDQEEAMNMSDRIAIMNGGRIEQLGVPREVYEQPANEFVAKFLGEANLLSGKTLQQPGITAAYGQNLSQAREPRLFVRPERIALSTNPAAPGGTEVSVEGVVKRVSFLGNIMRHGIDVGGDELLTADIQNNFGGQHFDIGARVHAAWNQHDARILEQ